MPHETCFQQILTCTHYAQALCSVLAGDTLEHRADVALPSVSSLSGRVCRQLNSGPSQDSLLSYWSASASRESSPQLSCLRVPHSANGMFSILQA